MQVDASFCVTDRITVVDDIITRGDTLLAGASLIKESFPAAEVRAFALVRTMGLQDEIEHVLDPCTHGVIRHVPVLGGAWRDP